MMNLVGDLASVTRDNGRRRFLIPLSEAGGDPSWVNLVGGKAYNLGCLARAGFLVPPGFCLTVEACGYFLSANGLTSEIQGIIDTPGCTNVEKAVLIQQAVLSAELPTDLEETILTAYRGLASGAGLSAVAVRSSALAEDGEEASFAGQHDTFLNVSSGSDLIERVKQCWASQWTARATSYRKRLPAAGRDELAVLVQEMLTAERSGVIFTVNPVTGVAEIVVEATQGSGQNLVSGTLSPERFILDRCTREVIEKTSGSSAEAMDTEQVQELARLALEIEGYFGFPQDVEWAQCRGQTYLLQSRPVTATDNPSYISAEGQVDMARLLAQAEKSGVEIWTDDNVGEVFPYVVTPLSWSVLEPMGNQAFRTVLRWVGVHSYPQAGLFGRFYGRVYFNQSQFQWLIARFYPSRLGRAGSGARLARWLKAAVALAETGFRAIVWLLILPRRADRMLKAIPDDLSREPDPQELDLERLWAKIGDWQQAGRRVMEVHLAVTIFASLLYTLLDKLVSSWREGAPGQPGGSVQTAHLVAGLPGMKSAEIGRDLAALAAEISTQPGMNALFMSSSPESLTRLVEDLPAETGFASALKDFLDKHGHASFNEFELAAPRWREELGYVLSALVGRLNVKGEEDQVGFTRTDRSEEAQQQRRRQACQEMRRQLGVGLRRLVFEFLLGQAQVYSLARENLKYTFVMAHGHLRELYLSLADHLVSQEKLVDASELFYLTRAEISALLRDEIIPEDLATIIKRRRTEHESDLAHQEVLPRVIEQGLDGSLRPMAFSQANSESEPNGEASGSMIYRGVAGSAGVAAGRARVILDPAGSAQLEPGEILIARSTNPAWSPLLLSAGALVTEIGGLLSHGAIVAREFGLPAVLDVKGVTQHIRTGQYLVVDGNTGTVRVLAEE